MAWNIESHATTLTSAGSASARQGAGAHGPGRRLARPQQPPGDDQPQRAGNGRVACVQPRQRAQQCATRQRPLPGQQPWPVSASQTTTATHDGRWPVGIDRERLEEERDRQADACGGDECGNDTPGHLACRAPQRSTRPSALSSGKCQDGAGIARQQEGRQHQRRDAGRVNRVDCAVAPAPQIVRLQLSVDVRGVLAAPVVVLDPQVAVGQQALRDDQVVRFVAAGDARRHPPRRRAEERDQQQDRDRRSRSGPTPNPQAVPEAAATTEASSARGREQLARRPDRRATPPAAAARAAMAAPRSAAARAARQARAVSRRQCGSGQRADQQDAQQPGRAPTRRCGSTRRRPPVR